MTSTDLSPVRCSENRHLLEKHDVSLYLGVLPQPVAYTHQVPWRGIVLAVTLLSLGLIFVVVSLLFITQAIVLKDMDVISPYAVLVVGILCTIPGAYYVRIAVYASRGYDGYCFDDIPNFD